MHSAADSYSPLSMLSRRRRTQELLHTNQPVISVGCRVAESRPIRQQFDMIQGSFDIRLCRVECFDGVTDTFCHMRCVLHVVQHLLSICMDDLQDLGHSHCPPKRMSHRILLQSRGQRFEACPRKRCASAASPPAVRRLSFLRG